MPTPKLNLPDLVKNCVTGMRYLMSHYKYTYARALTSVRVEFETHANPEDLVHWPQVEAAARAAGLDRL